MSQQGQAGEAVPRVQTTSAPHPAAVRAWVSLSQRLWDLGKVTRVQSSAVLGDLVCPARAGVGCGATCCSETPRHLQEETTPGTAGPNPSPGHGAGGPPVEMAGLRAEGMDLL